jgi:hypothetical protein
MTRIIASTGRWVVILTLALGAAALLLERPLPGLQRALRGNDFRYPFYNSILWSIPYLLCSWSVLTRKRWAVGFVFALSSIELVSSFIVAILLNTLEARTRDIFGLFLVLGFVFILPSAKEFATSRRNQPA